MFPMGESFLSTLLLFFERGERREPNAKSVKDLKESFVSNLSGTTFSEVLVLTLVIIFATWVRKMLHSHVLMIEPRSLVAFLVDFLVIVMPGILGLTVLSDYNGALCTAMLVPVVFFAVRDKQLREAKLESGQRIHNSMLHKYVWDSLTEYRSILCLYTFISILAVDFNAFPRRFAKAEAYGVGLMDVGVGSFVISDALLSKADQRGPNSYSKSGSKGLGARLSEKTISELKASLQLAIVGILRILAVKAISYHQHVGEYGVHWNFFLTLAVVKLVSLGISAKLCGWIALLMGTAYQLVLRAGLADYVNSDSRDYDNLLSMNKEGIVSLVGYVCLHCLARLFAHASQLYVLTDRFFTSQNTKIQIAYDHFYFTVGFTCSCWIVACFLDMCVERVSRRSVNLAYIFWILANNLTWLCVIYTGRLLLDLYGNLFLCSNVNKFAFLAFIAANILVGIVNSTVNTLSMNSGMTTAIITAYMLGVCCLSRALFQYKGKLRMLPYLGKKLKAHSPETEL